MARHNVKEQIVEAALKTLLEKGFNACGVQEITAAAGVPKGSFYNHFESKEALGVEIVARYMDANPRRAVLRDRSLPGLQRLRTYYETMNALFVEAAFERGCLVGNFSAELSGQSSLIRDSLRTVFARWTQDLEMAIADAQADGSVPTRFSAADLAAFLLDAYEGALLRARVDRNRAPFDRFMRIVFDHLLT